MPPGLIVTLGPSYIKQRNTVSESQSPHRDPAVTLTLFPAAAGAQANGPSSVILNGLLASVGLQVEVLPWTSRKRRQRGQ